MIAGRYRHAAILCSAAALTLLAQGVAMARDHRVAEWSVYVDRDGAFAADCQRCDEDRGMSIECKNGNSQATLSFEWLEPQKGRAGSGIDVVISIDGDVFRRSGFLSEPGMVGSYPVISLNLNDPLLAAISAGNKLDATADDKNLSIPLKGSTKAILKLLKACR